MASLEDQVAALNAAVAQIAANAMGKSGFSSDVESAGAMLLSSDEEEAEAQSEALEDESGEAEAEDETGSEDESDESGSEDENAAG